MWPLSRLPRRELDGLCLFAMFGQNRTNIIACHKEFRP